MKFYKDYISERLGQSLLETSGICCIQMHAPECFINEFYIAQEF